MSELKKPNREHNSIQSEWDKNNGSAIESYVITYLHPMTLTVFHL